MLGIYFFVVFGAFSGPQRGTEQKPKSAALAAYEKTVYDAIGQRWHLLMERDGDQVSLGALRLSFTIRPDGRCEKIQVVSNSSNYQLDDTARKAVIQAKIPPIPAAVLRDLPKHKLDLDIDFKVFANP